MIAVFRTSVQSPEQVQELSHHLSAACQSSNAWNFDLDDCDHILRIDSGEVEDIPVKCRAILQAHGFLCEGLE